MKFIKEKSPLSTKAKVVDPADFVPSAKVIVKKQDSSFQNWEVSRILKNLLRSSWIYSKIVL